MVDGSGTYDGGVAGVQFCLVVGGTGASVVPPSGGGAAGYHGGDAVVSY